MEKGRRLLDTRRLFESGRLLDHLKEPLIYGIGQFSIVCQM